MHVCREVILAWSQYIGFPDQKDSENYVPNRRMGGSTSLTWKANFSFFSDLGRGKCPPGTCGVMCLPFIHLIQPRGFFPSNTNYLFNSSSSPSSPKWYGSFCLTVINLAIAPFQSNLNTKTKSHRMMKRKGYDLRTTSWESLIPGFLRAYFEMSIGINSCLTTLQSLMSAKLSKGCFCPAIRTGLCRRF